MKSTKIKGFSLAEVLISLTVVSILLAAAAPVLTKYQAGDNTWQWTNGDIVKNGTSFDGSNMVIGARTVPTDEKVEDYFKSFNGDNGLKTSAQGDLFLNNGRLNSKLSIIKPKNDFKNSHVAFYNIVNSDTEYAGRLASDKDNLGLGIASLQSNSNGINNTAIGHYALAHNEEGNNNVALGYGALANNNGANNTAIGYNALANTVDSIENNVVIGNDINSKIRITGNNNLVIGNYNTNLEREWLDNNILIGHNAGSNIPTDWNKDNVFAIGNVDATNTANLIQSGVGPTKERVEDKKGTNKNHKDVVVDRKKLVVNGDFVIRSADGSKTLFKVDGTGETISYDQARDASIRSFDNVSGADRCEGAEVCIGKFNIPFADCGFLSPVSTSFAAYDIYIPTMAVGVYHSSLNKIPYLSAALLYLDRYKDTKGSIISLMEKRDAIFTEMYGFSASEGFGIIDWLQAFFGISSDARLKNIYGDSTAGLNEIEALKIKNYTYKADKAKTPHVGVIAQELQKIFPNSVIEGSDGYLSIKQEEMFFGLVNSIQELSDKNDKVSEKIALSKEQMEYTKKQNKLIEQENKLLEKQNKEFAKRIAKLKK